MLNMSLQFADLSATAAMPSSACASPSKLLPGRSSGDSPPRASEPSSGSDTQQIAAVSAPPRVLQRRLHSPERQKRAPEALRQAAEEKQARAERTRQQLEAERLAKVEKVQCCSSVNMLQSTSLLFRGSHSGAHATLSTGMMSRALSGLSCATRLQMLHLTHDFSWTHWALCHSAIRGVQANQERQAVRSQQGEAQLVRQQAQAARHAQSARRRLSYLHTIVQRATDESEKVKEVQFIRQLEAEVRSTSLHAWPSRYKFTPTQCSRLTACMRGISLCAASNCCDDGQDSYCACPWILRRLRSA